MARGPNRRSMILDVALRRFRSAGFDGTSIAEIAEEAGVSKAAISFHFDGKEAMLAELVEPMLEALDQVIRRHPDPGWPEGVWELAGDYFDVLVAHRDVATWIDADTSAQRRVEIGRRLGTTVDALVAAISGGSDDPVERVRAVAAVGGIWRPIRMLPAPELRSHRDSLLHAALVSYAPFEPPVSAGG